MNSCESSAESVLRSVLLMAVETTTQVTMPAMGESVTEGTVLTWLKQEGDHVEADDPLVEVSTDKVDAEVPSPVSGVLAKIHVAEGDTVQVGQLLAEIGGNGAGPAEAPAEEATEVVDIVTPSGGESVTEGTILEWAVKVGDAVEDGQTVVEITTDKVDMELPAPAAGTITEILVEEGATVTVGQVIARMALGAGGAAPKPQTAPSAPAAAAPTGGDVSPAGARVAAGGGGGLPAGTGTRTRGGLTK